MKRLLTVLTGVLAGSFELAAQTSPIFYNNADYYGGSNGAPQIDATIFLNQAVFSVYTTPFPFDAQNTLYWTNKSSGTMYSGYSTILSGAGGGISYSTLYGYMTGFRFDYVVSDSSVTSVRKPASVFHNQGRVYGSPLISVSATNIVNPGTMSVGVDGLLSISGQKVDLSRGLLTAGGTVDYFNFADSNGRNMQYEDGTIAYSNPRGVTDVYFGVGSNGRLGTNGALLDLPSMVASGNMGFSQSFVTPNAQTPTHQVLQLSPTTGRYMTNSVYLPTYGAYYGGLILGNSYNQYTAIAISNSLSATSAIIQVIFVPTNSALLGSNVTVNAKFYGGNYGANVAVVEFASRSVDPLTQETMTNAVYLIDNSASVTNWDFAMLETYAADSSGGGTVLRQTRGRPTPFELVRSMPYEWTLGTGGSIPYTPSLLYNNRYNTNRASYNYAAYSATIDRSPYDPLNSTIIDPYYSSSTPIVTNPASLLGRIEIEAGQLDLTQTRIRAENYISIKATNIVGNRLALLDAPVLNYDLGSTNRTLAISNFIPTTSPRLSGQVYGWSARWRNSIIESNTVLAVMETNNHTFHVLVVDGFMQPDRPVAMYDFAARATNVMLYDALSFTRSMTMDSVGFTVASNATKMGVLNFGYEQEWTTANFPKLRNLTNQGTINIYNTGRFYRQEQVKDIYGMPMTVDSPYDNVHNYGTLYASSLILNASNWINSGYWYASGGSMDMSISKGTLQGGMVASSGDMTITGGTLFSSDATLYTMGTLYLNVTNRLYDAGFNHVNSWYVQEGVTMSKRPASGDLLGTRLHVYADTNRLVTHTWAGEDRGATASGFQNNAAIGWLSLDSRYLSLTRFQGAGSKNALYVDYIEFLNQATNLSASLEVDPNFTIYFANANIAPDKLNGALKGRLVWVPAFAGANSTIQISVDGRSFDMNSALMVSPNADLDADGVPNKIDTTPLLSGSNLNLKINYVKTPRATQLSWDAIRFSTNWVEFRTNLMSTNWSVLTNVVQGASNGRVTVQDTANGRGSRYYRVRVSPYLGLGLP